MDLMVIIEIALHYSLLVGCYLGPKENTYILLEQYPKLTRLNGKQLMGHISNINNH